MSDMDIQFDQWLKNNALLRIEIYPKGEKKQIIWGRLVKYFKEQGQLLVYHDDEKKIHRVVLDEVVNIDTADKKKQVQKEPQKESKKEPKESKPVPDSKQETKPSKEEQEKKRNQALEKEAQQLITKLSAQQLEAIMPMLKLFSSDQKQ